MARNWQEVTSNELKGTNNKQSNKSFTSASQICLAVIMVFLGLRNHNNKTCFHGKFCLKVEVNVGISEAPVDCKGTCILD